MTDTNQPLIWVHGDCLDPLSPALSAYPDAPAVFVFDDEMLSQYQLSLKRVQFMYECLLEIKNIEIRQGDVVEELAMAAHEHDCERIVTVASVAPRFGLLATRLRRAKKLPVEVLDLPPFVQLDPATATQLDLKRFSRYWQPLSRIVMDNRY